MIWFSLSSIVYSVNPRGDYFSLVRFLHKKIIKLNFFLKKPKPVQTDRFWFGSVILKQKLKLNRLVSIWFGLISVRLFLLKTKSSIVFWGFFL